MDEREFGRIYAEHRDAVYRYARLLTGSSEAAEDIAQECFLAIAKGNFRPDTLSLLALQSRGFQLVGEVDGNVMRFQMGGEKFEVVSKENIAPGGGRWNVYGRLSPKNAGNELVIGTIDL